MRNEELAGATFLVSRVFKFLGWPLEREVEVLVLFRGSLAARVTPQGVRSIIFYSL